MLFYDIYYLGVQRTQWMTTRREHLFSCLLGLFKKIKTNVKTHNHFKLFFCPLTDVKCNELTFKVIRSLCMIDRDDILPFWLRMLYKLLSCVSKIMRCEILLHIVSHTIRISALLQGRITDSIVVTQEYVFQGEHFIEICMSWTCLKTILLCKTRHPKHKE